MRRQLSVAVQCLFLLVFALLIWTNWRLRRDLRSVTARAAVLAAAGRSLDPGVVLPPVVVRDRAGLPAQLLPNRSEIVLVVVAPGCGTCERVLAEIAGPYRVPVSVVAISPGELPANVSTNREVNLTFAEPAASKSFVRRVGHVPRVLRVAPGGMVRKICASVPDCE